MRKKLIINKGDKYRRLTIIKEIINKGRRKFLCKCDCWNIKTIKLENIRSWISNSCWCYKKEITIIANTTHWMYWTKIYWVYAWIKRRCENKNVKNYNRYWWRWIKCEWNSFEEFYKDMWDSYEEWLTIDRINNNWNYYKENCRWATYKEQARNTRKTLFYKWRAVREWCEELGLNFSTFYTRKNVQWLSIEESLFYNRF
jgi:glycosyltransferase involved in cell wall biosynthesis